MENNKTQYRKLTFEEMKEVLEKLVLQNKPETSLSFLKEVFTAYKEAYKEKYGVEWIKPDKDYSKETRKMIKTLDNLK